MDGQVFRPLRIEFNMAAERVVTLCCEKYNLSQFRSQFSLYEWIRRGDGSAQRRIEDHENVAQICQRWQAEGHTHETARFIFSYEEQTERALMARASVLQADNHVSQYGKIQPPPDISGLMNALMYYFEALDTRACDDILLGRPDGAFLVRDGARPDEICIRWAKPVCLVTSYALVECSYVSLNHVYHVPVKFDIHGFYFEQNGPRHQAMLELLQYACTIGYPLGTAVTREQVNAKVALASQIRSFACYYNNVDSRAAEALLRGSRPGTFIIRDSSREGKCFASMI